MRQKKIIGGAVQYQHGSFDDIIEKVNRSIILVGYKVTKQFIKDAMKQENKPQSKKEWKKNLKRNEFEWLRYGNNPLKIKNIDDGFFVIEKFFKDITTFFWYNPREEAKKIFKDSLKYLPIVYPEDVMIVSLR